VVKYEVLKEARMKMTVFLDVAPCILADVSEALNAPYTP
jgi:hypothetical protein